MSWKITSIETTEVTDKEMIKELEALKAARINEAKTGIFTPETMKRLLKRSLRNTGIGYITNFLKNPVIREGTQLIYSVYDWSELEQATYYFTVDFIEGDKVAVRCDDTNKEYEFSLSDIIKHSRGKDKDWTILK